MQRSQTERPRKHSCSCRKLSTATVTHRHRTSKTPHDRALRFKPKGNSLTSSPFARRTIHEGTWDSDSKAVKCLGRKKRAGLARVPGVWCWIIGLYQLPDAMKSRYHLAYHHVVLFSSAPQADTPCGLRRGTILIDRYLACSSEAEMR